MKQYGSIEQLLQYLIKSPSGTKQEESSLLEWYRAMRRSDCGLVSEDLSALHGGFYANSAGQAFIYGYEIAIQRLTDVDTQKDLAAFCVTENKSTHPQSMQTSLSQDLILSGTKDFVTLASEAKWLLVAAKAGVSGNGRNQIKLVKVDASSLGVDMITRPPLPVIPDIAHGAVTFNNVLIESQFVFSGDGYDNFVKPFRWFEDINVFMSLSGYLLKLALFNEWPLEARIEMISIVTALASAQRMDADDPIAHVVMFEQALKLERWLDCYDDAWLNLPSPIASAWKRDRGILKIAGHARLVRYKTALNRLGLT